MFNYLRVSCHLYEGGKRLHPKKEKIELYQVKAINVCPSKLLLQSRLLILQNLAFVRSDFSLKMSLMSP